MTTSKPPPAPVRLLSRPRVACALIAAVPATTLPQASANVAPPDATGVTPVAVSASAHDGNLPENTLDGDLATRWSAHGHGAWISYDLGDLYALGSLDVAFHQGDRRRTDFTVRTSTDGEEWTTVYTGSSSGETLEPEEHRFTDAAVRHVRIVGQGNSDNAWNSITVVQFGGAHGEEIDPPDPPSDDRSDVLPSGQEIVHATFDVPRESAPISGDTLRSVFETSPEVDFQWAEHKDRRRTSIVANPEGPGNVLRVRVPARRTSQGALFPIRIGDERGHREVWLEYRFRFGDGFQFVRGGKLPGLSGGPGSGPEPDVPHGGNRHTDGRTNGFSARHMWMNIGVGFPHMRQYVYHPHRSSSAGEETVMNQHPDAPTRLRANRWYTVTQRVVINTPGRHDGIIEGWIDGQRHYRRTDYNFRTTDRWGINLLHFHVYFGGSSSAWAHSRDEEIFFDDVRVIVP